MSDRARLIGLTLRGIVFWVDPAQPAEIEGAVVPKGLPKHDTLVSIASRPANGQVYARSRFGSLYRINLTTGAAKQAGAVSVAFGGVTYEAAAFSPCRELEGHRGEHSRYWAAHGAAPCLPVWLSR